MSFSLKFVMKNPLMSSPYFVKKRQFCQNYTIFWVQKVNRMPFFSDFSKKNKCSYNHILSKRLFSKIHVILMLIFCQKTSILTKTNCSHIIFLKTFIKYPLLSCPFFVKNNVNSVKTTLYYLMKLYVPVKQDHFLIWNIPWIISMEFSWNIPWNMRISKMEYSK